MVQSAAVTGQYGRSIRRLGHATGLIAASTRSASDCKIIGVQSSTAPAAYKLLAQRCAVVCSGGNADGCEIADIGAVAAVA